MGTKITHQTIKQWEQSWQKHWKKAQLTNYEIKNARKSALEEHDFLIERRTPQKEQKRLERISKEFEKGFQKLYKLEPAITDFLMQMMKEEVFKQEEIGFARVVDTPQKTVDSTLRSLPLPLKNQFASKRKIK